jgi:phage head maturation protease
MPSSLVRLSMLLPGPPVTATSTDRTITGLACPFGQVGRTSAGPVTVAAGAIRVPPNLRSIKLFREHGREHPLGYALTATEEQAGLRMSFRAAATPDGDAALLEASEGVRDALSVELDNVRIEDGVVLEAELTGVALTAVPAFPGARLVASAASGDGNDGGNDNDNDGDDGDGGDSNDDSAGGSGGNEGGTVVVNAPAGGTGAPAVGASRARGRNRVRGLSLDAAMRRVVHRIDGTTDAAAINAALSDITPGSDTSDGAFIRPQWIDEIWTPLDTRRPYSRALTPGVLTGMKVFGWKWGTRPVVGPYAGNKAPIPSNPVTFLPAEADAYRHAGGWDVDNIFLYLGDSSMLSALFQAAALDYAMKIEATISATLLAEATAATADDFPAALTVVGTTLAAAGARPSFVSMSADLWSDYMNLTTSEAPWWLSSGNTNAPNVVEGTTNPLGLSIFLDATLPAGTVLGGDRQAATHYEPRGNPFRVQAVNIPNGGVDIGVFGFAADLVNDSRGLVAVTVGPVVP